MKEAIEQYFSGNYKRFFGKYLPDIKCSCGDEYNCICPFHNDQKPSFSFNNVTGKYFCHGCGKKGHAFHFYAKLHSLDTRRDFPKILKGICADFGIEVEKVKPKIEKIYSYVDGEGNKLFEVLRMNPKGFRQRVPDGKGGYNWNLNGCRRVLYRLPDVLRSQKVCLVEGEKDCDNLMSLGIVATTAPGGANQWRDEYTETLAGKDIVLIPDNDKQGGEFMLKIAQNLQGKAESLKWLELPDLPSKGDVSDYISKYDHSEAAERLQALIAEAKPYEPPKKMTLEDVIVEADTFASIEIPKRKTLLSPWLTEQSIAMVVGWRGTGKTWFALSLLESVSRGQDFGNWKFENSVATLYLDGEMSAEDVQDRQKQLVLSGEKKSPLYVYSDAYANYLGLPRANLLSETWRKKMQSILTARHIKLWVIDNLASLCPGIDENSKKDWSPINEWLLQLRFAGISTILLHHTGKGGAQRGTSAREDNLDTALILKHPPDYNPEDGCSFVVNFSKSRVRTQHLNQIKNTSFKLQLNQDGRLEWTFSNAAQDTKKEILRLISDGVPGNEIAKSLGVTPSNVSHAKRKAVKDGFLTDRGKLTQSGHMFIEGEL